MTKKPTAIRKEIFLFKDLPKLKGSHDKISLGGFSGLAFEGVNPQTGRKSFLTHTDRGPNSEQEMTKDKVAMRRFGLPEFNPVIVRFELDEKELTAEITEVTELKSKSGGPISGMPNLSPNSKRKDADELPFTEDNKPLAFNPSGLDLEGVIRTPNGDYWFADEYRPSIVQFNSKGKLLNRYIPEGTMVKGMEAAVEALPAKLGQRQMNRGFEAIAVQNGKILAFLQSPLDEKELNIPVIEFDIKTKKVTNEYTYTLEGDKADKLGDAIAIGKDKYLVIEQNSKTNDKAFRKIFEVTLAKDQPLNKKLIADLAELDLGKVEKFEGLAAVSPRTLALVNDNDFSFLHPDQAMVVLLHFPADLFE